MSSDCFDKAKPQI